MTLDPNSNQINRLQIDEPAHRSHIVNAAIHASPLAVDAVGIPHAPGAYLLLYSGDFPAYQRLRRPDDASNRSIMLGGGYPIYGGSATDLHERCGRHRHKLSNATDLALYDFQLIALETSSPAAALYAEGVLIAEFQSVWNQYWMSGFGSKSQGRVRESGQRVTPWNQLHASYLLNGRHNATSAHLVPKIRQHLTSTVSTAHGRGI